MFLRKSDTSAKLVTFGKDTFSSITGKERKFQIAETEKEVFHGQLTPSMLNLRSHMDGLCSCG